MDVELAFVSDKEVMELLEVLIAFVYSKVVDYPGLAKLNLNLEVPEIPFKRITYAEAIELLSGAGEQIESKGLGVGSFEFYLEAFCYGMLPHAGWVLGVERLLMSMLEIENIREVVLFPRDRRRLAP